MTPSANNTPDPSELELINAYARNPLEAENVYCFSLTLCDNEVDRDFERFSVDALKALMPLFEGKTGISDHSMSAHNQKARIYKTWLEQDNSRKTLNGESYTALKAKAYMLITDETKEMIEQIEGGIKKEVSVGCSMGSLTCSICGKDMKTHECKHIKGKYYGKKLCHGILSDARDAYEWSFVAVPAQKNAGVTKAFCGTTDKKSAYPTASEGKSDEALFSTKYVRDLERKAEEADFYKGFLTDEIKKYALIAMNKVNIDAFIKSCEAMEISQLKALAESLKAQAAEIIPVALQLKSIQKSKTVTNNNSFKI